MPKGSWPFFATAVVLAILGGSIGSAALTAAEILFCTAGLLACVGLWILVSDHRRRSDPYSLSKLRELHEEGETPKFENDLADGDSIYCTNCETVYSNNLPVCPRCRKAPTQHC